MKPNGYRAPPRENWATQTGVYRTEIKRLERDANQFGKVVVAVMLYLILGLVLVL